MITGAIAIFILIAVLPPSIDKGEWGVVGLAVVIALVVLGLGAASRESDRAYNNRTEYWAMDGKERAKARHEWEREAREEEARERVRTGQKATKVIERPRSAPVQNAPPPVKQPYRNRTAMDDIMMTHNRRGPDVIMQCAGCGVKLKTDTYTEIVNGCEVMRCKCPVCGRVTDINCII